MKIRLEIYKTLPFNIKKQLMGLGVKDGQLRPTVARHPQSKVLLAMEEEKVLGWLLFVPNNCYSWIGENQMWLYVRSTHRRRGIGTKLLLRGMKFGGRSVYRESAEDFFCSFTKRKLVKSFRNWKYEPLE